jgi:hypothetical protein
LDRVGPERMSVVGLLGIAAGCLQLAMLGETFGVAGYVAPIVIVTAGYALFQTANNTAVMADTAADQRGVIAGMLNLSRNLGLISGASLMGAVFFTASGAVDVTTAHPQAVASGTRVTFAVGAVLILVALVIVIGSRVLARNLSLAGLRGVDRGQLQSLEQGGIHASPH